MNKKYPTFFLTWFNNFFVSALPGDIHQPIDIRNELPYVIKSVDKRRNILMTRELRHQTMIGIQHDEQEHY